LFWPRHIPAMRKLTFWPWYSRHPKIYFCTLTHFSHAETNSLTTTVFERVERILLCLIFLLEVDNHSNSEFSIRKIYHSGVLDSSSIIAQMKGSHSSFFAWFRWKLLFLIFLLEIDNHSYSEFSIRKIYHSGELDWFSIISCMNRRKWRAPIQPF
jgi:hypothetical protein